MGLPARNDMRSGLGWCVRQLRSVSGLSQMELARRARVSQPFISQLENGRIVGPLYRRTLCDLADALGVDLDALVAGDPVYEHLDLDEFRDAHPAPAVSSHSASSLIGRANDVAAVVGLLRGDVRLLTLVGPGGVGKTRLAVHAAGELASDFPDGVFVIPLAAALDPGSVLRTIARAVGLRERDARPLRNRLLSDLPAGRLLLMLDNVEQALPAVAELIGELLAAYPDIRVLATSRIAFNIRGERQYAVMPLGVPDTGQAISIASAAAAPAVELFVQRARDVVPRFALTEQNAAAIAAIVWRLDGLPLAIELAAARVRVLAPGQLLRQLDRRLAVLTTGPRDLPARQRSLRASIEWSVALLDNAQQALLRRLAIFASGFTLDAAEWVASDDEAGGGRREAGGPCLPPSIAEGIDALLEHHLLTRVDQAGDVPRFGMLETIHEYAREQLELAGEVAALAERHLAWCLSLAEQSVSKMFTGVEPTWLQRLQREDANFEAALCWAFGEGPLPQDGGGRWEGEGPLPHPGGAQRWEGEGREGNLEAGLRLAGALTDYWYISGQLTEGREWLTRAITASAHQALSLGRARSLVGACLIEQVQAAIAPALAHGEEGLAMARALADRPTIARALLLLGNLDMMRGELQRARSLHAEALSCFRDLSDHSWTALALINLGMDFHRLGELEPAATCAEDALAITRAIDDVWDMIVALRLLGEVSRDQGNLERATTLLTESLALAQRHGSEREIADSLSAMATVAVETGEAERAACLLAAAEALYRHVGIDIPPPLRPDWRDVVARIQDALGPNRFARAWTIASPELVTAEVLGLALSGA